MFHIFGAIAVKELSEYFGDKTEVAGYRKLEFGWQWSK